MKEINSFKKGITSGIPIAVGYFSVSFAFGIFVIQNGLSVLEAFLISLTNLTSAGQFAGVPIIATGGSLLELAMTELVINSRYALMSVTLSQKLGKSVTLFDKFLISFANTDEIFAVSASNRHLVGKRYMYGLAILPIIGWSSGTLFGALAGDVLPTRVTTALGVAIYGMFIAIVVPTMKKEKSVALCVLISALLSLAFNFIDFLKTNVPSGFTVIICAVVASLLMAIISPMPVEVQDE